ncbi:MAG: chorismate mutase [Acidobacteria bacterium]|nr:chorismate mutase [Acidobacteriota bacterium]
MSLEDWRMKIDQIDEQLVKLLNERSRCAIEIGKIKRAQNLALYSPEREHEILRRVKQVNGGPLDDEAIRRLFERIMDESRRVERLAAQLDISK